MQPLLNTDFPQDLKAKLQMELASLPDYNLMLSIINKIHLATDEMMADIPLYLLVPLLILAQNKKMDKAIAVIEREIELNLEEQRLADEAEQWAREQKRLADKLEALEKSITMRINSTTQS